MISFLYCMLLSFLFFFGGIFGTRFYAETVIIPSVVALAMSGFYLNIDEAFSVGIGIGGIFWLGLIVIFENFLRKLYEKHHP